MRRHGLLAGRQKPRGKHPFGERDMRPLDDSADRHRERLGAGFTHEVPEVDRYLCLSNSEFSSALSRAAIAKPRRVIAEQAQLPERSHA